jgi:tetratricopeptide (TPR) repeat protein
MAGPIPLTVAEALVAEWAPVVADSTRQLDSMSLRRVVKQAETALFAAPAHVIPGLYHLIGMARWRLNDSERALAAFRNAATLEPHEAQHLMNVACCQVALGDHHEALATLAQARKLPSSLPAVQLHLAGNESEVHHRLGNFAASRDALNQAIRLADPTKPFGWFFLATQAAIIGAEDDAMELLARHLIASETSKAAEDAPAVEIVRQAPAELKARIAEIPELLNALAAVDARFDGNIPLEHQLATEIRLQGEAWKRLNEALEANGH